MAGAPVKETSQRLSSGVKEIELANKRKQGTLALFRATTHLARARQPTHLSPGLAPLTARRYSNAPPAFVLPPTHQREPVQPNALSARCSRECLKPLEVRNRRGTCLPNASVRQFPSQTAISRAHTHQRARRLRAIGTSWKLKITRIWARVCHRLGSWAMA